MTFSLTEITILLLL